MNVLDLFSGIGGFSLGLERAGMRTVGFCEIEEFPRKILRRHWPDVPIFEDVRNLTGEVLQREGISADVICGGYPCQPFSTAGKRRGSEDDRHLWPEFARIVREVRPRWVIGENVAGHIHMGLDDVLSDLEGLGYTAEAFVIPACAVGALHRRDRVWIIAYPMRRWKALEWNGAGSGGESKQIERNKIRKVEMESCFCRNIDGIPRALDRLKSLGNAVVPQIVEVIGKAIIELEQLSNGPQPQKQD